MTIKGGACALRIRLFTSISKSCHHIPVIMNGKPIPHSQTAKYLGMTLDAKLRWKVHVKKKETSLA